MGGFSLLDRENPPQIQSGSLPAAERRSVQILHPFMGSVQQYVEEVAGPDRYRPHHCPREVNGIILTNGATRSFPMPAVNDRNQLSAPAVNNRNQLSASRAQRPVWGNFVL